MCTPFARQSTRTAAPGPNTLLSRPCVSGSSKTSYVAPGKTDGGHVCNSVPGGSVVVGAPVVGVVAGGAVVVGRVAGGAFVGGAVVVLGAVVVVVLVDVVDSAGASGSLANCTSKTPVRAPPRGRPRATKMWMVCARPMRTPKTARSSL